MLSSRLRDGAEALAKENQLFPSRMSLLEGYSKELSYKRCNSSKQNASEVPPPHTFGLLRDPASYHQNPHSRDKGHPTKAHSQSGQAHVSGNSL